MPIPSLRVAGTISKALYKTFLNLVFTLGLAVLFWQVDPRIGMMMLVVGPVLSMIRSYRQEFPLHWATILLPAFATLIGFIIQLVSMSRGQALTLLAPGVLLGLLIGGLQGRGHRVILRGARVMAKRTSLYLIVWALCFLLNQGAALFGQRQWIGFSMSGAGFSTALVVAFSLVLFRRYLNGRRQFVRLKRAIQPAALFAILILSLVAAVPARLEAQDAQDIAQKLLTDADLPPRYTLVNRATQEQVRNRREQALQGFKRSFAPFNLTPPEDIGALASEFDHNPMANEAILTLSLVRFPDSQAAASFYQFARRAEEGSWEEIPGCGDMASRTMNDWCGFAYSVRGRWAIEMIMQYPYSELISDYDRSYDSEKLRQAQATARGLVMGPLANMMQIADQRLAQLIGSGAGPSPLPGQPLAALRLRGLRSPDPKYFNRRYGQGSLPASAAAAAAAAAILLLSAGAATGAAGSIASATASALQAAASSVGPSAAEAGSRILSGDEAVRWLTDNGFIKDGQPTDKFTRWQRQPASAGGPDKDGLDAMVGEWSWGDKWGPKGQLIDLGHKDKDGNWVPPQVTIVARDVEPPPPPEQEPPPPPSDGDPGTGPEEPEGKESPPEKEQPPPSPDEACKGELGKIQALEAGLEKIRQLNQTMQNEINELNRQWRNAYESWACCSVVDGLNFYISEQISIANPYAAVSVSLLQSAAVNAVKNTIKEYFGQAPGGYGGVLLKAGLSTTLKEIFAGEFKNQVLPLTLPGAPGATPALTAAEADKVIKSAGTWARVLITPGYIGRDFSRTYQNAGELSKLIDHKRALIDSNDRVIAQQERALKEVNDDYLDCAGRAMDAMRRFVARQQETKRWMAQQRQAQRDRLRRSFGS
jgi:hypothetical protein